MYIGCKVSKLWLRGWNFFSENFGYKLEGWSLKHMVDHQGQRPRKSCDQEIWACGPRQGKWWRCTIGRCSLKKELAQFLFLFMALVYSVHPPILTLRAAMSLWYSPSQYLGRVEKMEFSVTWLPYCLSNQSASRSLELSISTLDKWKKKGNVWNLQLINIHYMPFSPFRIDRKY